MNHLRFLLRSAGSVAAVAWSALLLSIPGPAIADQSPNQALYEAAKTAADAGDTAKSIQTYRQLLAADPTFIPALDDLAWILATSPDSRYRDPAEAEKLAARVVEITHFKVRRSTGVEYSKEFKIRSAFTLSAAFAAEGKFTNAIECVSSSVETAREMARSQPAGIGSQLLTEATSYLKLFQAGQAFVAPATFKRTPVPLR